MSTSGRDPTADALTNTSFGSLYAMRRSSTHQPIIRSHVLSLGTAVATNPGDAMDTTHKTDAELGFKRSGIDRALERGTDP